MATVRATGNHVLVVRRWGTVTQPRSVVVHEDELRDSDDPVVVEHPWAFEPADAPLDRAPEAATAAPGEVRSTKRPAKKRASKKADTSDDK